MKIKNTLLVITVALALHTTAAHAVVFTTNTTIGVGIPTYDGQLIVVSNCTLTVNGVHRFASLLLTNNAVLTHSPAPAGEANNRLDLAIAGEMTIDAASRVDVNGKGYGQTNGPGAGASSTGVGAGGGGHGGRGGDGYMAFEGGFGFGGTTNDSSTQPAMLGSGGGHGHMAPGGSGGGALRLTVYGTLQLDGAVRAIGAPGTGYTYGGGGAGGSLWIEAGALRGGGMFDAGGGSTQNGGGGGGGRIAIYCADTNGFTGWATAGAGLGAYPNGSGHNGYAGTVRWFSTTIPPLLTATQQGSGLLLSWPSVTNVNYQLQSATNLPAPSWTNEGTPFGGTGGVLTTNLPISPALNKFFRLQIGN